MRAMVLGQPGQPLHLEQRPEPAPGPGEVLVKVEACAVCRTDLHVIDGELSLPRLPLVPGHEIVGLVEALGQDVFTLSIGQRIGIPWLARSCGHCRFCRLAHENLCDEPLFTGHGRDGGFASHVIADAAFCIPMTLPQDPVHVAPLLCAGVIGWRSLRMAGDDSESLGLYGFGAAAHLAVQCARLQGRRVFAFTRTGDVQGQAFARSLGAVWAGSSEDLPPEHLDAAIIFAPVGTLVPVALQAVRKGGRVVCGGIHMSDLPSFPYSLLWGERQIVSVADMTREDAAEFFRFIARFPLKVQTSTYQLEDANIALADLRAGRVQGAAVIVP